MQILLVLAVLAAMLIAEACPHGPVSYAGARLLAALAAMALPAGFAALSARSVARRLRDDALPRPVLMRRLKLLRRLHALVWLAMAGLVVGASGWPQLVRFNWRLDRVWLVDDLLILAPVLVPMVLSWAAFYEVDRALRGRADQGAAPAESLSTRCQYVLTHVRHYLGVFLVPLLVLVAVQDAAQLWAPQLGHGWRAVALYAVPLGLLLLGFPLLLRYIWRTSPLGPGPLRERLEAAARRAGLAVREILVWHTGGMLVNAAVAGFLPQCRYVFLTDGLLANLTDQEIEAVFWHEVGHVRHRHLGLRVVAMLAPLSLWILSNQLFPELAATLRDRLAHGGLGVQVPVSLVALAAMSAYVLLVFGRFSRLLECQADLYACRMLQPEGEIPPAVTFMLALEKLAAAAALDRKAAGWQHGSVAARVAFLVHVAGDTDRQRRFQRGIRLRAALLLIAVVSPLALVLLPG